MCGSFVLLIGRVRRFYTRTWLVWPREKMNSALMNSASCSFMREISVESIDDSRVVWCLQRRLRLLLLTPFHLSYRTRLDTRKSEERASPPTREEHAPTFLLKLELTLSFMSYQYFYNIFSWWEKFPRFQTLPSCCSRFEEISLSLSNLFVDESFPKSFRIIHAMLLSRSPQNAFVGQSLTMSLASDIDLMAIRKWKIHQTY